MPVPSSSSISAALGQLAEHGPVAASAADCLNLLECFQRLPDPRDPRGVRHALASLLAGAAAAVLAGARSFTAIGEWIADAPAQVMTALGVRRDPLSRAWQPPDESTVRRLFEQVATDALDAAVCAWLAGRAATSGAADGEGDYQGGRGSSSRAKKAAADFRISLTRRSSRTSRSSSAIRCASAVEVPGRCPSSTSACLTQPRNASRCTPSCWATRAMALGAWPVCSRTSKTIRTARSRTSCGYFLGAGIAFDSPFRQHDHAGFRAFKKVGAVQTLDTPRSPAKPPQVSRERSSRLWSFTIRYQCGIGRSIERRHHPFLETAVSMICGQAPTLSLWLRHVKQYGRCLITG